MFKPRQPRLAMMCYRNHSIKILISNMVLISLKTGYRIQYPPQGREGQDTHIPEPSVRKFWETLSAI